MWPTCWKAQHQLGSVLFTFGWEKLQVFPLCIMKHKQLLNWAGFRRVCQGTQHLFCFFVPQNRTAALQEPLREQRVSMNLRIVVFATSRWEFMSTEDAGCLWWCLACCATMFLQRPIMDKPNTDCRVGVIVFFWSQLWGALERRNIQSVAMCHHTKSGPLKEELNIQCCNIQYLSFRVKRRTVVYLRGSGTT